jgi:hypothetical protein
MKMKKILIEIQNKTEQQRVITGYFCCWSNANFSHEVTVKHEGAQRKKVRRQKTDDG